MKRVQLFEFEDFEWFPNLFRDSMTKLIVVLHKLMGIPEVLAKYVKEALDETKTQQIVDLGSGSGGPMPMVFDEIHRTQPEVHLTMTDLHPNKGAIRKFNADKRDGISYHETSVDATNFKSAPEGLKTMVNSFHHMPPEQAKQILKSAQDNQQPLLIYEMAENNIPLIIWWIMLPISLVLVFTMSLFMTPFSKPSWQQLVFTYIIPIIPICYAWDGQASLPRMYTMSDIDAMLNEFPSENYVWKKGRAYNSKGKKQGTFVLGVPQ